MNRYDPFRLVLGAALASALVLPALAQNDKPAAPDTSGRMTIVIERDGRVTIDGRPAPDDFRVAPGDERRVRILRRMGDPVPGEPFDRLVPGEPPSAERSTRRLTPPDAPRDGRPFIPGDEDLMLRRFGGPPDSADVLMHLDDVLIDLPDRMARFSEDFDRTLGDQMWLWNSKEAEEAARLEREARSLAREARSATGDDRRRKEAELQRKLDELFEMRTALREQRLGRLEQQLRDEQRALADRKKNRKEIVERRMKELLGEQNGMDW